MEGTIGTTPARHVNWLRRLAWGAATGLLLLPAVAMQFTREVDWTASDFVIMGLILYGCCLLLEVAVKAARNSTPYLAGAVIGIGTGFLTLWITLAVGIIGAEDERANLAFLVVLAIALLGSLGALYRARGMAIAMFAAAAAQGLTGLYALWLGSPEGTAMSLMFTVAWAVAGGLFRRAAREQAA